MDSFVSRKRRNSLSSTGHSTKITLANNHTVTENDQDDDEEESTEVKLATLASLFPDVDQNSLLDFLIVANGSVSAVSRALGFAGKQQSPRKALTVGYQSSLAAFRTTDSSQKSKKSRLLTRKGQTLHLYTPEDIASHTPCSIIHNFLSTGEADELLKELLNEASTFERQTFKLFDNVVQSPHSACFYVDSLEEETRQKTEYLYNGSFLTVRFFYSRSYSSAQIILIRADQYALGYSSDNPTNASRLFKSSGRRQSGDRDPDQNSVSGWQKTQISITRCLGSECRIC